MRPRDNRIDPLIWTALAGAALALVGAVGMTAAPSSDVRGSAIAIARTSSTEAI